MDLDVRPDGLVRAYRRARWSCIAGAWGAIYAFEAARHSIDSLLDGRGPSVAWLEVSAASLGLWALYTPFILWVGRRAPFEGGRRGYAVVLHGAALLALIFVDAALQRWLWLGRVPWTFLSISSAVALVDGFSYVTVLAIGHVQRSNARDRERERARAA